MPPRDNRGVFALKGDPRLLPKGDNSTMATSCQVSYSGDGTQLVIALKRITRRLGHVRLQAV